MIVELVQAEADQLRLKLDGGWPWETFRTELAPFTAFSMAMPIGKAVPFERSAWFPLCCFHPNGFMPAAPGSPRNPGTSALRAGALPVPASQTGRPGWQHFTKSQGA
jgi:hypothetical protein